VTAGAGLLLARELVAQEKSASTSMVETAKEGRLPMTPQVYSSPRHTSNYWEAGPATGPLMVFVHGWPETALVWRAQVEAFAAAGWRCIAPDMRGYGGSSAPPKPEDYALGELVQDMAELHDHLGAAPAVWVGHDLGSPVGGSLSAHHPRRSRGVVLLSVPYSPDAFALPSLLPLIDRKLYPVDQYPDDQWDYYRRYLTDFDQVVNAFDADVAATLSVIYRSGTPDSVGHVYRSALVTATGDGSVPHTVHRCCHRTRRFGRSATSMP